MKAIKQYCELDIPVYAISALVNDDRSGITDEDESATSKYMQQFYDEARELGGIVIFSVTKSDFDSYFSHDPEFGLPCDCVECTILIVK